MCETLAGCGRNWLPSHTKSIHNFPILRSRLRTKNQSSQLGDRISAVRDKSSSGSYDYYSSPVRAAFEILSVGLATCGCWQIPKTFSFTPCSLDILYLLQEPSSNSRISTDFLGFFGWLINGNEKRCEIANAKIMIWAGNLNLQRSAEFFTIPPGVLHCTIRALHNSTAIVHHHLAKCDVRVLSPFLYPSSFQSCAPSPCHHYSAVT